MVSASISAGALHNFSKLFLVGAVGYFYDQLTADSGSLPILWPVESRVVIFGSSSMCLALGALIGY
jgi:hypothetical protein